MSHRVCSFSLSAALQNQHTVLSSFWMLSFSVLHRLFRLVATIDEPSLPETAYLTGLTFMVGGMAVNACGIYGVYSGQGSGRSIMIATLTLIEALVLYSMAGGLIKSPAVKRVVTIMYRVAAVLLIALGVGLMAKEQFSERTVILGTMLLIEAVCLWKIKFEKAQFKEGLSG